MRSPLWPTEAPDLTLTLFALPSFAAAHPELAERYEVVVAPVGGDRRSLRVVAERTWLAAQVRRRHPALLHHAGGTAAPGSGSVPVVLSMHDIQYMAHPEYFSRVKLAWLRHELPSSLARAGVVTAPSEFVASSLVEAYGVDPDRLVVVPHGLPAGLRGRSFRRGGPARPLPGPRDRSCCTRRRRTRTRTTWSSSTPSPSSRTGPSCVSS